MDNIPIPQKENNQIEPHHQSKKLIWISSVVVLLVIAGTFLILKGPSSSNTVSDDTQLESGVNGEIGVNKNIYINKQYGFEITYSKDLVYEELNETNNSEHYLVSFKKPQKENEYGRQPRIYIGYFDNKNLLPLKSWILANATESDFSNETQKPEDKDKIFWKVNSQSLKPIQINGEDGFRVSGSFSFSDYQDYVLISRGDKVFFIEAVTISTGDLDSYFEKMFLTFKFNEVKETSIATLYNNLYIGEIFKSGFAYIEPFNIDRGPFREDPITITDFPKVTKIYPVGKSASDSYDAVFNSTFYSYIPDTEEDSSYFFQGFSTPQQSGLQYKLNTNPNETALVIALFNQEIESIDYGVVGKRPYSQVEYDKAVDEIKSSGNDPMYNSEIFSPKDLNDTIIGAKQLALFSFKNTNSKLLLSEYRTHGFEYASDVYVVDFIKDGKVIQTYEKYNSDGPY